MFDVVVLGSANLDLVAGAERLPSPGETVLGHSYKEFPGGKGLNQAVAASRLGARVALVGAVGADEAGRRLLSVAAADGIETEHVEIIETAPTGRALITVDGAGQNCIVVVPGANEAVTGTIAPADLADRTVLLAQLEVPLRAVARAFAVARATGATTVLNPAPATPLPDDLLAVTDVIVPNEHEVELLGGASALLDRGVEVVVVTRGAAGVSIHEANTTWHEPAVPVTAVDTTGAGDAFCGALAGRLAAGANLREAIAWAAAAGAHAATVAGAVPSLPRRPEVEALLAPAR